MRNNKLTATKKFMILLIMFSVGQYVFAVDGTLNGGGSKAKASSKQFSTIKKDLNLSLKYGYTYNGNKTFDVKKSDKFVLFNSVVSYKKGNVTYLLPYRNKTILQRFKTPTAPLVR